MKKIYLVIAGAFLILLIITSMLLSLSKKSTTTTKTGLPLPTGVSTQDFNNQQPGTNSQGTNSQPLISGYQQQFSTIEPIETLDFKAAYVPALNKIVVEKKTPKAEELFYQWINQNQLNAIIDSSGGKKNILFTNEKIIPTPSDSIHKLENKVKDFFQLMDDLNNIGKGASNNQSPVTNNPSSIPNNPLPSQSPTTNNQSLTYYAQCGDQGSLPLPNGCTMCSAGCGAATTAMIASSYVSEKYNLKTVVDIFQSKNYGLGCSGSSYLDAHELLSNLGLKTTDYFYFEYEKSDTVAPQLKKYIDAGWTFFALARFCDDPNKGYCGHIFWITDVDSKRNIWAYDPAYGRYEIPYNENTRYPYPLYRVVFGVKK